MAAPDPFYDYCVNVLGTPLHWYRMDSATPGFTPDIGDAASNSPFGAVTAPVTAQVTGAFSNGSTSLATGFSGGWIDRTVAMTSNDFGSTTTGTVAFWFKGAKSSTAQVICGAHPAGGAFLFLLATTGAVQVQITDGSDNATFTTKSAVWGDDAWHQVVFFSDGVNANQMWIDGEIVDLTITTAGIGTNKDWLNVPLRTNPTTTFFRVGNSSRAPGTPLPFTGSVDEIQFYSGTLTPGQIRGLYRSSKYSTQIFLYRVQVFANPADVRLTDPTLGLGELQGGAAAWANAGDIWSATASYTPPTPTITGTAAWTLAGDIWSATGTSGNSGTSAWTLAGDVWSATGTITNAGSAAWTLGGDTWSATGSLANSGTAAWVNGGDVWSATGSITNVGTATWTLGNDVWNATGATNNGGTATWLNGNDIWNASGAFTLSGSAAWVNGDDIWNASGGYTPPGGNSGDATWVNGDDIWSGTGDFVSDERHSYGWPTKAGWHERLGETVEARDKRQEAEKVEAEALADAESALAALITRQIATLREVERASKTRKLKALQAEIATVQAEIARRRAAMAEIRQQLAILMRDIEEIDVAFVAMVLANS